VLRSTFTWLGAGVALVAGIPTHLPSEWKNPLLKSLTRGAPQRRDFGLRLDSHRRLQAGLYTLRMS
jgi:hypothetical protein